MNAAVHAKPLRHMHAFNAFRTSVCPLWAQRVMRVQCPEGSCQPAPTGPLLTHAHVIWQVWMGTCGASGGQHQSQGGSVRCMWRAGGVAVLYVYLPTHLCTQERGGAGRSGDKGGTGGRNGGTQEAALSRALAGVQHATYREACHCTGTAGHDLFRAATPHPARLIPGACNTVCIGVRLNAPGRDDGVLAMSVNGTTHRLDHVRFRAHGDLRVEGLLVHTWFGGGTNEWAPPSPQRLAFHGFRVGGWGGGSL
jgi:hypothetical protein